MNIKSLILFILFLFVASCNTEGFIGVSDSIKQSKKDKMFICEYKIYSNDDLVKEEVIPRVRNCFLEKRFYLKQPLFGKTELIESTQNKYSLVITGIDKNITLLIDSFNFMNASQSNISKKGQSLMYSPIYSSRIDTLNYMVYKNKDTQKEKLIGELVFIRKHIN